MQGSSPEESGRPTWTTRSLSSSEQEIRLLVNAALSQKHPQHPLSGCCRGYAAVRGCSSRCSRQLLQARVVCNPGVQRSPPLVVFHAGLRAAFQLFALGNSAFRGQPESAAAADTCLRNEHPCTVCQSRSLANFGACLQGWFCSRKAPSRTFHPCFLCLRPRPL